MRNLVLVLGDHLDADSAVFRGFDRSRDSVRMAEVEEEAFRFRCRPYRAKRSWRRTMFLHRRLVASKPCRRMPLDESFFIR